MPKGETQVGSVESLEFTEPPDLQKIEGLAQFIAQARADAGELADVPAVITERDHEAWAARLRSLKIGDLPFELPKPLREELGAVEEVWASEVELIALKSKLSHFLAPSEQEKEELKREEKELDLENERLVTLKMLAELLDELLQSQPESPLQVLTAAEALASPAQNHSEEER